MINCLLYGMFRIKIAIPATNVYPYYEQCQRKDLNFTELLKSGKSLSSLDFQTNETIKCTQWEYNFTQIPYPSIGTEVKYLYRCLNRMLRNSYTFAAFFCHYRPNRVSCCYSKSLKFKKSIRR